MFYYSSKSKNKLLTTKKNIQKLFHKVLEIIDHSILCGNRGKEAQNKAYYEGRSKIKFPNGKHNKSPSAAVDASAYPIVWPDKKTRPRTYIKDLCRFYYFAGIVIGVAHMMKIKIRWGGDWDRDHDILDQSFDDLVHFEEME